ncbi:uncharacterized protein LOC143601115 [Bidens hawaiensis]|uniref:uncharacterized protein LOC143601115 n=1 Tax=Bidens hawaiensis TaxID=980011 RepID=UPI004049ED8C
MPKIMEDLSVYESTFNFYTQDEPKVAEKTKGKAKTRGKKALADISNMSRGSTGLNQDYNSGPSLDALRKHIEQLQQEKSVLMKHLTEKNKVIELSGYEMQKLRVTLQKMKEQNLQLAQSNSQMQTELRVIKEKQKVLNHELACKNGVIIAKNLEFEEKIKTRMCEANYSDHNKVTEPVETEVRTVAEGDDDKHDTNSSREISKVNNSTVEDNNDKGKSKRLQKRRQSAKFKVEDSLKMTDIDDVTPCSLPVDAHDHDDGKMKVNDYDSGTSSSSKTEDKGDSSQESRKTSLSRPVRASAKKVQSYKEINVNAKMRRE